MSSSSKSPLPPPLADDWRYETAVAEAESIISQIESGDLELEDVFEQFTQAVTYLKQCETFLTERQAQVDLLVETLEDSPAEKA
jgi:exodeoxyribonuclease VII small subunit